jgi:hypothetical protein
MTSYVGGATFFLHLYDKKTAPPSKASLNPFSDEAFDRA